MKLSQRDYIAIAALCFATLVFAQGYGTIGGTLQDPSGAAVPNGEITVTNTATGVATTVASLTDGKYLVSTLLPGTYQLAVQVAGFKRYVSSGIEVHVSDRLTLNVALELGETKDTVQVTGETPLLRTEDSQMGEVINNNFISSMPQLNRNPFELMRLSGNVQGMEGVGITTAGVSANSQSALRINGGRTSNVDFYVDGGSVNTGQGNRLSNQTPSMDAVQEFKVVTEGISAEYGRVSGGYVELVTKSGTNSYHGSLYEYMFNDMFNANAWDQNALGNKKVHFRQNNYGFTLGGPVTIPKVYKGGNRTFFFVDNEYLKKNQSGSLIVRSMPNELERTGDFSQTLYQGKWYPMYDPWGPQVLDTSKGLYQRTGLLGGDGRHVPASRISPVSKAILALLPMPNRPSVAGSSSLNNYAAPQSLDRSTFRFGVRLDHTITANQRISIRYNTFSAVQATSNVGGALYTSASTETNGGIGGGVNYNWTMRPTMLIAVRASVTHNPLFNGAKHPADFKNSFLPAIYQKYIGTDDTPQINVRFMGNNDYAQSGQNLTTNSTTYNYAATATKILSHHTVKFGGEARRYYDNFTAYGATNSNIINYMYNPVAQYQGDWGLGAIETNTTGLGSMLMGINNRNNVAARTTRAMNVNYYGLFVQDDF